MGKLGNIGGVEREAGMETVQALMRLDARLDKIERTSATQIRNNVTIIEAPPGDVSSLPETTTADLPIVLPADGHWYPDGTDLLFGEPYRITGAEFVFDNDADAASANTTFTLQNASASPTSSGTVTVPSGSRRGINTALSVNITPPQRLYIKSPASLNGLQRARVRLKLEQQP